jgi:hypothetical protein
VSLRHADSPVDPAAAAARRHEGHRQSSPPASGMGKRTDSSMHQQAPLAPPEPHSNVAPQRAQARRRNGNVV